MEEEEQEYNINLPKQYSLNKFEVYNKRIRLYSQEFGFAQLKGKGWKFLIKKF